MSGRDKSSCGTPGAAPGRTSSPAHGRRRPLPRNPRRDRDSARWRWSQRPPGWRARERRSTPRSPMAVALALAAAAAERVVVQLGPRSWYTASTSRRRARGAARRPAARRGRRRLDPGHSGPESVWRRKAAEGGVAALQGLAAGIVGTGAADGNGRSDVTAAAAAMAVAIARQRRRPLPDHARAATRASCSSSGRSGSASTCSRACSSSRCSRSSSIADTREPRPRRDDGGLAPRGPADRPAQPGEHRGRARGGAGERPPRPAHGRREPPRLRGGDDRRARPRRARRGPGGTVRRRPRPVQVGQRPLRPRASATRS